MDDDKNLEPASAAEMGFVDVRGVQRLAGAILVQAIEDIRCGSGRRREDAIRWMANSSEEQFSFVSCCKLLNRDPEEVRRFLVRRSLPSWVFSNAATQTEEPQLKSRV
ncbi:MAG: hypothetical protein HY238_10515 [Acidobacteria bacterium]|nr:hypothetical protein [Acidobacteriota bacterium]